MLPGERSLVPLSLPLIGFVEIDRPIYDDKKPRDPLVNCLPLPDIKDYLEFGPSVWDPEAFTKSFEKHFYAEPKNFVEDYPQATSFADRKLKQHYSFLNSTSIIDIASTEKNTFSCPAYPKLLAYDSEEDYLKEHGWVHYINEFERVCNGAKPRIAWYLFLKKEILKKSKIQEKDIRQIVCSDPIFARIGAVFEQHQNNLMKSYVDTSSGQCGWTPFYGGFQKAIGRLSAPGFKYVEFDWTRFDGTIPPQLFKRIKYFRFLMMEKPKREKLKHVYTWYVSSLLRRYTILPNGEVTLCKKGNPSGQISTTMDNNLVNYWLQAFEFYQLNIETHTEEQIEEFWKDYDTLIYGDDRLTSTPILPDDYVGKVIQLYKEVFGMWVKEENVKVSDELEGLSFCGFLIGKEYLPLPAKPYKLMASLLTPTARLPDIVALHGKLLCFQLLCHHLDSDHPFKRYLSVCLDFIGPKIAGSGLPARFTDSQLDAIWRGGPNSHG